MEQPISQENPQPASELLTQEVIAGLNEAGLVEEMARQVAMRDMHLSRLSPDEIVQHRKLEKSIRKREYELVTLGESLGSNHEDAQAKWSAARARRRIAYVKMDRFIISNENRREVFAEVRKIDDVVRTIEAELYWRRGPSQ